MANRAPRNKKPAEPEAASRLPVSDVFGEGDGSNGNGYMPVPIAGFEGDLDFRPYGPSDFSAEDLLKAYHTMLLSRRLDEKMLTLLKQGKGFFHIGGAGHEATQAAIGSLARPGHDWFSVYYRDLCTYLSLGGTA